MKLERRMPLETTTIVFATICFLLTAGVVLQYLQKERIRTDWFIHHANAGQPFQTGQTVDFQIFVEDDLGHAIEDATVKVVFDRPTTVHQMEKTLMKLENGLYQSEVLFSLPGTWVAMVEVRSGNDVYRDQLLFDVEGNVTGKQDPDDSFDLEQQLPDDIVKKIQESNRLTK